MDSASNPSHILVDNNNDDYEEDEYEYEEEEVYEDEEENEEEEVYEDEEENEEEEEDEDEDEDNGEEEEGEEASSNGISPNAEEAQGRGREDNGDFVVGISSQKRLATVTVDGKDSDIASCPICMEPWSSQGPHRICSLLCGHLYGRHCIEKWIRRCRNNIGKCPQCNEKCKLKDIIDIYAPQVVVVDDDLHKEVISLRAENEFLKMKGACGVSFSCGTLQQKVEILERKLAEMTEKHMQMDQTVAEILSYFHGSNLSHTIDDIAPSRAHAPSDSHGDHSPDQWHVVFF
ncbi:uncharacterized protein LOC143854389 isoform X2 [Tasmannia lanceolata]|uniref:uncharacterized protein LOC143854389 isoform X2 n=1 Tax=Tasmannia lanceolata TaxID=3420 RepID=UPI0040634306